MERRNYPGRRTRPFVASGRRANATSRSRNRRREPNHHGDAHRCRRTMKVLLIAEDMPNVHPVHGDGSSLIPFHLLQQIKNAAETWLVTFAGEVDVPAEVTAACRSITVLPLR